MGNTPPSLTLLFSPPIVPLSFPLTPCPRCCRCCRLAHKKKSAGGVIPRRSDARYSLSRMASMIQALTLWPAAAAAALIWALVGGSVLLVITTMRS